VEFESQNLNTLPSITRLGKRGRRLPVGHDVGQKHLYLNYVPEHWIKRGENPPVGLISVRRKVSN
jgi:hypothetical protein